MDLTPQKEVLMDLLKIAEERNDNFFNLLEVLVGKGILNQEDIHYIRYHKSEPKAAAD